GSTSQGQLADRTDPPSDLRDSRQAGHTTDRTGAIHRETNRSGRRTKDPTGDSRLALHHDNGRREAPANPTSAAPDRTERGQCARPSGKTRRPGTGGSAYPAAARR